MSVEYSAVTAELTATLAAVAAGSWEGIGAHRYLDSHLRYLVWLAHAGSDSAAVAAQIETAAGSYTAALAAMPTPAELAFNRATHAALVATNFFGVNTVPIALNEADYMRMWVQAATTMSGYAAISASALAATPQARPSPPLLMSGELSEPLQAVGPGSAGVLRDPIEDLLSGSEHFLSMYRMLKQVVSDPLGTLYQILVDFAANPSAALVTWQPLFYLFAYGAVFAVLGAPLYAVALAPAALTGLAGLAGLSELAGAPDAAVPAVDGLPARTGGDHPAVVAPLVPAAAGPAAVPAAPTVAGASPAPLPATGGAELAGYLVRGDGPGTGFGPAIGQRAGSVAQASSVVAAAAAASGRIRRRSGRRRVAAARDRSHRYEFLTADADSPVLQQNSESVPTAASESSAGQLGFAGAAAKAEGIEPAGIVGRAESRFGNRAPGPVIPGTWSPREGER